MAPMSAAIPVSPDESPPAGHLAARDFERIARAIRYIDAHWQEQPTLPELARHVNLSPFHFSRLFHQWAGVAPKTYIQSVTGSVARERLATRLSALDTALSLGLSGPSRLHDLMIKLEAMTPAEAASLGEGVDIEVGVAPSPFGLMRAGITRRGVCDLAFVEHASRAQALRALKDKWPAARLTWNPAAAARLARKIWPTGGEGEGASRGERRVNLWVRGSAFQVQVWRALLALADPANAQQTSSYGALARAIGQPKAARAVGAAIGANPIAWLIPCHRVLRTGGALGGYHWGLERKRAILAWEALRK